MSPLSSGRSALSYCTLSCSTNALAIALNYVCQRRQFSDPKSTEKKEYLLIDYPITKYRMIPLVAQSLVYYTAGLFISSQYVKHTEIFKDPSNPLVNELHALSAVLKPKATWFSNRVIT